MVEKQMIGLIGLREGSLFFKLHIPQTSYFNDQYSLKIHLKTKTSSLCNTHWCCSFKYVRTLPIRTLHPITATQMMYGLVSPPIALSSLA